MSSRQPVQDSLVRHLYLYSSSSSRVLVGIGDVRSPAAIVGGEVQETGADCGYPAANTSVMEAFTSSRPNPTRTVRPDSTWLMRGGFAIGGSKPWKSKGSRAPHAL